MAENPLTLDEHRELAQELRKTVDRLTELAGMVRDVYGSESRSAAAFGEARAAMERIRAALGDQAAADCPGSGAEQLYRS